MSEFFWTHYLNFLAYKRDWHTRGARVSDEQVNAAVARYKERGLK